MTEVNDNLKVELYKYLKQESQAYVGKVSVIQIQKFILIGAIIGFIVTKYEFLELNSSLKILIIATIPCLAILLDAKVF